MARVLSPTSPSPLATFSQQSKASPLSSPTNIARRIPRTRSRTRMSPGASLESIVEECDGLDANPTRAVPQVAPHSTSDSGHTRIPRPLSWNGKNGISTGRGMRDVCGICFESAVKPNKSRCCGQLFCYQHLSDWLSASASDGRCPTCRVPLSLETDTIFLHPPVKKKLPSVSFLPAQPPSRRRSPTSPTSPWSRRLALVPRRTSSSSGLSSGSSSSPEYDSDVGSSSTSESEVESVLRRSRVLTIPSRYESVTHLMSDLMPLREFGSLLSLLGCALVIGTLLS
ncbi:hypothetical protein EDB85DRAFT_1214237 [Lactarius pseudohatsudake]|nr:hypothetical protein EDB85DRAFT_1214237 [Lactarius pseudohatsudake]